MNRKERLQVKVIINFFTAMLMVASVGVACDSIFASVAVFLAWTMGMTLQIHVLKIKERAEHGSKEE